jgi:hypothetical protein
MTSEKFQFRNKTYIVDQVIDQVIDYLKTDDVKTLYDSRLKFYESKIPVMDENTRRCYGKMVDQIDQKNKSLAKKKASTDVLNAGFSKVIGGGCTNNSFAPEQFEDIDVTVVHSTLDRIRNI